MGLPAWAYGEDRKDSLIEWEDRGAYFYNRKTGEKRPKGVAGGSISQPKDKLHERLDAWEADRIARQAQGEREARSLPGDPINVEVERGIAAEAGIDFNNPSDPAAIRFREGIVARNRGADTDAVEDRSNEVTLPHWIDEVLAKYGKPDMYGRPMAGPSWLPRETIPYRYTKEYAERHKPEVATGRPSGWEDTFDPHWLKPNGSIREAAPEEVHRGIDESVEWSELRSERKGDPEEGYEATKSPLVLRKRHPNGTVTYVHALTGQPLFDLGEYGLNDPQADGFEGPDPYWREGRRDW